MHQCYPVCRCPLLLLAYSLNGFGLGQLSPGMSRAPEIPGSPCAPCIIMSPPMLITIHVHNRLFKVCCVLVLVLLIIHIALRACRCVLYISYKLCMLFVVRTIHCAACYVVRVLYVLSYMLRCVLSRCVCSSYILCRVLSRCARALCKYTVCCMLYILSYIFSLFCLLRSLSSVLLP